MTNKSKTAAAPKTAAEITAICEQGLRAAHRGREPIKAPHLTGQYGFYTVNAQGFHSYSDAVNEDHARAIAALIPGAYPVAIVWQGQKRAARRI